MSAPERQRIQSGDLFTDDIEVQCRGPWVRDGITRCRQPAIAYIEYHAVGHCNKPWVDDDGLIKGFVCPDCLDWYEQRATGVVRNLSPPRYLRWLLGEPKCPSCHRQPIQLSSDVLQIVQEI